MTENACLAVEPVDPSEHVRLPYSAGQPCEESVYRAELAPYLNDPLQSVTFTFVP